MLANPYTGDNDQFVEEGEERRKRKVFAKIQNRGKKMSDLKRVRLSSPSSHGDAVAAVAPASVNEVAAVEGYTYDSASGWSVKYK